MATTTASSSWSLLLPESLLSCGTRGLPSFSSGCCGAATPHLQGMEIKLKYAIPKAISLSGFELDVSLDVSNPNTTSSLCTTGFTYRVAHQKKGGEEEKGDEAAKAEEEVIIFAEGMMEKGINLPGGETTTVVIPVQCSYNGGVGSLNKKVLMGEPIHFVMSGDIRYKIPLLLVVETSYTLPYRVEGSFSPTKGTGKLVDELVVVDTNKKQPKTARQQQQQQGAPATASAIESSLLLESSLQSIQE